jgi:hypothetical protein
VEWKSEDRDDGRNNGRSSIAEVPDCTAERSLLVAFVTKEPIRGI